MEVILLEKVGKLGGLGDRVTVKGVTRVTSCSHRAVQFWQMNQTLLNSKRVARS